jgi:hypothetical protein
MEHKLSMNALVIALTVGAAVCFGAFVLYGAWIDGRRQKVREQGKHPVTEADGSVEAREDEEHG